MYVAKVGFPRMPISTSGGSSGGGGGEEDEEMPFGHSQRHRCGGQFGTSRLQLASHQLSDVCGESEEHTSCTPQMGDGVIVQKVNARKPSPIRNDRQQVARLCHSPTVHPCSSASATPRARRAGHARPPALRPLHPCNLAQRAAACQERPSSPPSSY